jgi:dienelactone hydrolase
MRVLTLLVACLVAGSATAAEPDRAPEAVHLPDAGGSLQAFLFKPAGDGPFPVVVAMHDCEGLVSNGGVRSSYRTWAERFNAAGFAVLFPDSFSSREVTRQCQAATPRVRPDREGVADVAAARQFLGTQDWVAKGRLSIVGWGQGAHAALWAVRPQAAGNAQLPDFRSAAVLFPGNQSCQRSARLGWSSRVPTLVLVGTQSNASSVRACQQMVANAKGRSALAQFSAYPELSAGPGSLVKSEKGADATQISSVVRSLAARDDGPKRVLEWLAR